MEPRCVSGARLPDFRKIRTRRMTPTIRHHLTKGLNEKSAIRMIRHIGMIDGLNSGVASVSPSTAPSTVIAGVKIPSL